MATNWSSCIASELDRVEDVMDSVTSSAENPQLREMCQYVISNHGKRVRPAFCILAYYMLGGKDPAKAIDIGAAVELIHNATLIHDDINDAGEMRRGAKALYKQ
jgi:geranylgeranyl pyrophosphate synthase